MPERTMERLPAKFRVGDVVRVVHHFDHNHRPSAEADARMVGNLDAVISMVSRAARGSGHDNSYEILWLGEGTVARVLPTDGSGDNIVLQDHARGRGSAWWFESCLELVKSRPSVPEELQMVLDRLVS